MTSSTPKIGYWIGGALVAVMLLVAWCKTNPEPTQTPAPEQQRITKAQADSIRRTAYAERDNHWQPFLKAQDREIIRLTSKDKQQHEKAQHSAATFVKTPTLDNCKVALVDCQEEVATKAAIIAKQAQRIDTAKAQRVNDSTEILASHKAAKEFNDGWKQANEELARKPLKVYATAAFEARPLRNNASLGGTATYDRWLLGYQKGVIENTHEIKAGFLLRVKKK